MNRILKVLCGVACAFAFCFLAIGYAAVQDTLTVTGSITIEKQEEEIVITCADTDAYVLDGTTGELTIRETYIGADNKTYRVIGIDDYGFSSSLDAVGYDASAVISVSIPKSVKTIGENAFTGCSNLQSFSVVEGNTVFIAKNGVLFNSATSLLRYPPCNQYYSTMLYKIPSDTASITSYAFCDLPTNTVIVTAQDWGTASPWYGAESDFLVLKASENELYNAMQRASGDSTSGYTITCDSSVANTNLVFKKDDGFKKWVAIGDASQFTIPSTWCNTSPSFLNVSMVKGDINLNQFIPDLEDHNVVIGGGEWSALGDDQNLTDSLIGICLEVNDGIFIDDTTFFYYPQNATITINGGYFETFVLVVYAYNTTTIKITGGEFKLSYGFDLDDLGETLKISGGVFNIDPSPYLVQGHIAVQRDDGMWEVVSDPNAALVNEEETPICSCETKCADLNEACEVCKTDITNCEGTETPAGEEPTCSCETKCTELTEACEVCKTDITNCEGTETPAGEELTCSCEIKCSELTEACELCKTDITNCKGTKASAENDPPADEQGEQPDAGEEQTTPPNDPPADEPSSDDGQSEQPTEGAETTTPSDVSGGDVTTAKTEETQAPDGQNASESEETSESVISTDPVILPPEDEEDGEEQESSDDQQGQE